MNLLKFPEVVNLMVREYPGLYWGSTPEKMKWNVAEYLFNCVGTGLDDRDGIKYFLNNKRAREILDDKSLDFLFEGKNVYEIGERNNFGGKSIFSLNNENLSPNQYAFLLRDKTSLYPNFSEDFSFFYDMKREDLLQFFDVTWFEAMKEFYGIARELINGDGQYQCKPTKDLDSTEWKMTKKSFKDAFEKYKLNRSEQEFYEVISKEYEHPYDGDLDKFLLTRWEKERIRINEFIDQVLVDIDNEINKLMKIDKKKQSRL